MVEKKCDIGVFGGTWNIDNLVVVYTVQYSKVQKIGDIYTETCGLRREQINSNHKYDW